MTLLEVMVALGIVGLLLVLLPTTIRKASKSDLRGDAGRLSAALRNAYDRAAATAAHHRVVIDFESETFVVQRCEGAVKLVRSIDEAQAAEKMALQAQANRPPDEAGNVMPGLTDNVPVTAPDLSSPEAQALLGSAAGGSAFAGGGLEAGGVEMPCTPVKGEQGKPQLLARKAGVSFKEVYVAHLEKPADAGQVTINFFPMGRGERAVVVLTDESDNRYSVRLHGLTGRVEIKEGELKRADDVVSGKEEEEAAK